MQIRNESFDGFKGDEESIGLTFDNEIVNKNIEINEGSFENKYNFLVILREEIPSKLKVVVVEKDIKDAGNYRVVQNRDEKICYTPKSLGGGGFYNDPIEKDLKNSFDIDSTTIFLIKFYESKDYEYKSYYIISDKDKQKCILGTKNFDEFTGEEENIKLPGNLKNIETETLAIQKETLKGKYNFLVILRNIKYPFYVKMINYGDDNSCPFVLMFKDNYGKTFGEGSRKK